MANAPESRAMRSASIASAAWLRSRPAIVFRPSKERSSTAKACSVPNTGLTGVRVRSVAPRARQSACSAAVPASAAGTTNVTAAAAGSRWRLRPEVSAAKSAAVRSVSAPSPTARSARVCW
ncbi:hypothetical protein GCM10018962_38660 [Dactylosporangium matsuzakiense]